MALIEMRDVSFTYAQSDSPALHQVDLTLEEGVVHGLVGRNASGKSTLCNLMRGIIPHFHHGELVGDVRVLGTPLLEWDPARLSQEIGYVFQNPFTQISGIRDTVLEELALGLENLGFDREQMLDRVLDAVHAVGIESIIDKDPNGLSGGQRQKVAFASILVMGAKFLVIDEPTSQLDPESSEEIFAIISRLKAQGTSIVLVEHKLDLLAEYADRLIVMDRGTVAAEGPADEILAADVMDDARVPRPEVTDLALRLSDLGRPLTCVPTTRQAALDGIKERMERASR